MELRKISYNTWDVFHGKGWNNHTRIRKGKAGVYRMFGMHMPRQALRELDAVLHPSFPINYGMSVEQTVRNLSHITRH